jgi:hypothetical protein
MKCVETQPKPCHLSLKSVIEADMLQERNILVEMLTRPTTGPHEGVCV